MAKKQEKNTTTEKTKGGRITASDLQREADEAIAELGQKQKKKNAAKKKTADNKKADAASAKTEAAPKTKTASKTPAKAAPKAETGTASGKKTGSTRASGTKKKTAAAPAGTKKGKTVRVIPLGGLGEIGKNMTLFETDTDIVIIDCGLGFPDEDMPGVDLVIPDFAYLREHSEKIRAVFLTHGHEDHIGGIPYFLRDFNVPVYGTALTIGIIEAKLREHKLGTRPKLITVRAGDRVRAGDFEAEFIHVNHSIADACAIALFTPAGTIVHSGDFKLDVSPIEGEMMNLTRFGELGRDGVKLLMCESTNAERPGFTPSEKSVGGALENIFATHPDKRIVVATFSSNVHRVMQIIDASVRHNRRVAITGRSMQTVVSAAISLGYMDPPADTIIDVADMKKYLPGQVTLITTGSQGEPMSALYRMAFADHAQVYLCSSDVVVFSSSTIPGNEKYIGRIVNELTHNGITVLYDSNYSGIHASGHACAEEIKLLRQLCNPEYYMPVHGEFKHLHANREIALYTGIPDENIFTLDIGNVLEIGRNGAKITESVPSGRTLIDGLGIGDVGKAVLRDRKALSEDGMVIIFVSIDLASRLILNPPEVITKGFVYGPGSADMIREIAEIAATEISDALNSRKKADIETLRERVRRSVLRYLTQQTGRNPMVIPFIADL